MTVRGFNRFSASARVCPPLPLPRRASRAWAGHCRGKAFGGPLARGRRCPSCSRNWAGAKHDRACRPAPRVNWDIALRDRCCWAVRRVTSFRSCTSQSSSTTMMHLVNIACPHGPDARSSPCAHGRRTTCGSKRSSGYGTRPAAGRLTSRISGNVNCISGRKMRFDRLTHPGVFHRRLADDRRGIDRLLAMGDAGGRGRRDTGPAWCKKPV